MAQGLESSCSGVGFSTKEISERGLIWLVEEPKRKIGFGNGIWDEIGYRILDMGYGISDMGEFS